jgi:hypothetical protein
MSRPGVLGLVPIVLCLLLGLLAISVVAHTAMSSSASAPSDPVKVTQTHLQPGMITFQLRNDDMQAVTIAQVAVNDAFWPFTTVPGATIAPHAAATITLPYPWDAGVNYDIQILWSQLSQAGPVLSQTEFSLRAGSGNQPGNDQSATLPQKPGARILPAAG